MEAKSPILKFRIQLHPLKAIWYRRLKTLRKSRRKIRKKDSRLVSRLLNTAAQWNGLRSVIFPQNVQCWFLFTLALQNLKKRVRQIVVMEKKFEEGRIVRAPNRKERDKMAKKLTLMEEINLFEEQLQTAKTVKICWLSPCSLEQNLAKCQKKTFVYDNCFVKGCPTIEYCSCLQVLRYEICYFCFTCLQFNFCYVLFLSLWHEALQQQYQKQTITTTTKLCTV